MKIIPNYLLKFIYPEKVTKFCEISTLDLSYVETVKSTVEILQNFVAFSEYMNFILNCFIVRTLKNSKLTVNNTIMSIVSNIIEVCSTIYIATFFISSYKNMSVNTSPSSLQKI